MRSECFSLVMLSSARVPAKPGSAQVEASQKSVLCHAGSGSSIKGNVKRIVFSPDVEELGFLPFSPFRQKWCDICAQPGWADAGIIFVSIAVAWPRSETPQADCVVGEPTMVLSETSGLSQSLTALLGYPRGHTVLCVTFSAGLPNLILTLEPKRKEPRPDGRRSSQHAQPGSALKLPVLSDMLGRSSLLSSTGLKQWRRSCAPA